MTTAHRPTFDPARGKETLRGPAYHQRLLPAHTQLKFRKPGQGGNADRDTRDLRAELLAAEQAHHAKLTGGPTPSSNDDEPSEPAPASRAKRALEAGSMADDDEDPEAKRRRIIEETRDIDADDSDSSSSDKDDDDDSDSDSDSDSDDEEAELQRELERVKRERQEKREREEREKAAAEAEQREREIARGNPLLNNNSSNAKTDFTVKRRWDDDVVFKNQARGTEDKNKSKEFVNDLLRSDFHKRFMSKYVR
ncbi:hypothetical protein diail_10446 [Diaporthe ilicicola]|nr:hypothetical protein diail_10446 [Diaporthe ilicicola]